MGSLSLSGAMVNQSYKPKTTQSDGEKCTHYWNTKHT